MKHRLPSLALAGVLSLSLLAGCGGKPAASPAPEASTPVTSETPAPAPTESLLPSETPAPESTPSAEPESSPSAAPSQKPSAKPTEKPSAKPSPAPTVKPTTPPASSAVVDDIWNDISSAVELPNLSDVDAETLQMVYGISADDLTDYVCKMPLMNVIATEYFIAEVKEGKMDAVKSALVSRQADLDQQWKQYLPEQYELVKNYKLVTNGNYILFVIGEHAADAVTTFDSYTK